MRDEEIIELYWKRDELAITASAESYGDYCFSIAYRILGSNEDAEECVNDTWMNAWRSMPPRRPNRLSTYLGKITRNLSLNQIKLLNTQKRGKGQTELALSELEECVPSRTDMEEISEEMVLVNAVETFLRAQPRMKRNIFVGRYWHLYPIRDLANAYHMSENKIAVLLYRMRRNLQLHLEKEGIFV